MFVTSQFMLCKSSEKAWAVVEHQSKRKGQASSRQLTAPPVTAVSKKKKKKSYTFSAFNFLWVM